MTLTDIHAKFAALPGSEQIASAFAVAGLYKWVRRHTLQGRELHVLEIGVGIGTLTATILSARGDVEVIAVEPDNWCREAWRQNLRSDHRVQQCQITHTVRSTLAWTPFDFVVIDGGDLDDYYYVQLHLRAVVFFEGRRREQRKVLRRMWAGCRSFIEAEWKPRGRSKGYAVVLFEPCWWERIWFVAVRAREACLDLVARLAGVAVGKKGAKQ